MEISIIIQAAAKRNDLCQLNPKQKPFYYHKKFDQATGTTVAANGRIKKLSEEEKYKPWMQ